MARAAPNTNRRNGSAACCPVELLPTVRGAIATRTTHTHTWFLLTPSCQLVSRRCDDTVKISGRFSPHLSVGQWSHVRSGSQIDNYNDVAFSHAAHHTACVTGRHRDCKTRASKVMDATKVDSWLGCPHLKSRLQRPIRGQACCQVWISGRRWQCERRHSTASGTIRRSLGLQYVHR